jgi:hypothetical protein
MQCQGGWLPISQWWLRSLASNIRKITKETNGNINRRTNRQTNQPQPQPCVELRFKESSLVLEAVGALHTLPNIAETIRRFMAPINERQWPFKGSVIHLKRSMVDADE